MSAHKTVDETACQMDNSNGDAETAPSSTTSPVAAEFQDPQNIAPIAHDQRPWGEIEADAGTGNAGDRSREAPSGLTQRDLSLNRRPSNTRNAPLVPSRSSSDPKLQSSHQAGATTSNPTDAATKLQREPSTDLRSKVGAGNTVTNTPNNEQNRLISTAIGSENAANTSTKDDTPKGKNRGVSRFLAFLNCCSAPEGAHPVGTGDQSVPARKSGRLQSIRGRQPTPITKPDPSVVESSTAESKEVNEEKVGGPAYSDIPAAAEPRTSPNQPKETVSAEKPSGHLASNDGLDEKSSIKASGETQPYQSGVPIGLGAKDNAEDVSQTAAMPEAPTAPAAAEPPGFASTEESVINDRTEQQEKRDSDIEMTDVPVTPTAAEVPRRNEASQPETSQVALPPPPPLAPRGTQAISAPGGDKSQLGAVSEKQQWLLPPAQPQFRGKKCLVLDLDETLVHSSFKVSML